MVEKRDIYFHEDDYCQQELLPRAATEHAGAELQKIEDFANAHRAPGDAGWTDMYIRGDAPAELRSMGVRVDELAQVVSAVMRPFDSVFTGYSSHRERCTNAAAWGMSQHCAVLADWDENGVVRHIWTAFFELNEDSIRAASKTVAAMGNLRPLIYVDWAWGYVCEASNETLFASALREKLEEIARRMSPSGER